MKRPALILFLIGMLAACGGTEQSSQPTTLPPLTSSAPPPASRPAVSPTATPAPTSSTAPVMARVLEPVEAEAETSEGAAAFVRYYIDVVNRAILTADSTLLRSLSDPECEGCRNYINSIDATASSNAQFETMGLTVTNAVAPRVESGETIVLLNFDADAFVARTPDGAEVARGQAAKGLVAELRCVWKGGSWIVMGFRLTSPDGS